MIWGGPVLKALALLCLGVAIFFDLVEFAVKGLESNLVRRLFEGTGPP